MKIKKGKMSRMKLFYENEDFPQIIMKMIIKQKKLPQLLIRDHLKVKI
jgi:hypothetical protein